MNDQNDGKTRTHVTLTPGTMVSHYRVIEKIGAGGMGEVFLAEDIKLRRKVALKFLSAEKTRDNAIRRQFTKEAQAAARLQHPNIITVHEVNEYEDIPFMSMTYIEGRSLKEIVEKNSLSIAEVIDIGIQIARGLTAAHEAGISHRDLKPGNLMMDVTGTVKILDFGLAVLSNIKSSHDPDITVTSNPFANNITGTILYMAPEQLLGQEISSRADIFAFGIIMYELIAGQHPFTAPSAQEISARILRDTPAELSAKCPNVPYDLSRIVSRCLNKRPDRRFQTARDVCNELEDLNDQLSKNVAVTVIEDGLTKRNPALSEKTFVINTELVRQLSHKDPKMIGSSLAYLDNGIASDTLVFYLHGIGADQGQFSNVLQRIQYRAIAISLFGFDVKAQLRMALTLHDHSILIHALIEDVCSRLRPRQIVLVGHSSGADHWLHYLASESFTDIKITGLLSLGCNIDIEDCFASGKLAKLATGDEDQILSIIKDFSSDTSSLRSWLLVNDYLLQSFSKFGLQTEPLRQYASDIFAPFKEGDLTQFPEWYKCCIERVPYIRFVFDTGGYPALDRLMNRHLKSNILGDSFHEDTIVRVPCSHLELGQSEWILKETLDFMKLLETRQK